MAPSFRHASIPAALLVLAISGCGEVLITPGDTTGTTSTGATTTTTTISSTSGGGGATTQTSTGSGGAGGAPSACPTAPWAKRYGGNQDQSAVAVAVVAGCDIFLAAASAGPIDLGNGPLQGKWFSGHALARLSSDGEAVWSRWIESSSGSMSVDALVADGDGNLIVTGIFSGTLDLGSGPITAGASPSRDVYVAKLDPQGTPLWVRHDNATWGLNPRGATLAVAPNGDIVLTGAFMGTLDFGAGVLTSSGEDIFIVKLSSTGETLWSKRFGGPGNTLDQVVHTAIGPAGEIVMAGDYEGALDFGLGPISNGWGSNGFLAALDASGNTLWSRAFDEAWCGYNSCPIRVAVEPSGRTNAFAPKEGGGGILQVLLDAKGNVEATRELGGQFLAAVAPLGSDWLVAGNVGDRVISRLGAEGDISWSQGVLSPENASDWSGGGRGISLDAAGNVIVVGAFMGKLGFESGDLESAGKRDMFIAKLPGF